MGHLRLIAAFALVTGATPILPAMPVAASPNSVRICLEEILPEDPLANLGECVSFGKTFDTDGFAAHFCDFLRDTDPDFVDEFGSYANCVRLVLQEL